MKRFNRLLATVTICTLLATGFGLFWIDSNTNSNETAIGEFTILYDPVPSGD